MQIHKFTEKTGRWSKIKLLSEAINFKSNANGFHVKYRTAEGDFQITMSPQECAAWLGEFQIAANQVEGQ